MLGKLTIVKKAVPFLKRNWMAITLGLIVLFGLWHYNSVINERDDLRLELRDCEATIDDFVEQEKEFIERIEQYNEKTEELQRENERFQRQAEQARERTSEIESELQEELERSRDIEIGETCEDAMDFLLDEAIKDN